MSERDSGRPNLPFEVKPKVVVIVAVVIALIYLALSSVYMVDQTEQAVVLTFGRFSSITGAGLHLKLPFGIQKNYNVPTQVVQNTSFGFRTERAGVNTVYSQRDYPEESLMLSGDLNIVDVEWSIQYRITDPRAWLFNVMDRQKTIRDISQSTVNMLVGDRTIFDVIGDERANIELQGRELMNERLDTYGLGINITTVKLRNIVPPAGSVQDAFEDVNAAIQDMNRLVNEGREAYNNEIPRVQGEADQLVQIAQGYAAERVNEARGDVARFQSVLEQYSLEPDITRTRLYYEMVEDVFEDETDVDLIDRNLSNFVPFKALQNAPAATGGQQ